MFISKEFKVVMSLFKEAMQAQLKSEKPLPIKKLQAIAFANGIFGLIFFFGGGDAAPLVSYVLSAGFLFVTVFFWGLALWLHLATPKGSEDNWPPQFRTVRQIRSGVFKLKNYPKLQKVFEGCRKM